MKNITEYTSTEKEMLELIAYHEHILGELKKEGKPHPDHDESIKILEGFKELVSQRVTQRKLKYQDELEEQEQFMQSRLMVDCEKCNAIQPVTIVGEKQNKQNGYICDEVVCSVCGHKFINHMPNNWDDRILFIDFLLGQIAGLQHSEPTLSDKIKSEIDIDGFADGFKRMKDAHFLSLEKKAELDAAENAANKSFEDCVNHLLMSKLQSLNYNSLNASS